MQITNFYLEPANYEVDFDALHYVRHEVFVLEHRIPPEVEFDELDRQCHHVIARDEQSRPIATGRLSPDGKIGRMAVLRDWRNQRVGQSMLRFLLEKARQLGLETVSADAQLAALDFYRKAGFVEEGAVFVAAGIPHQTLRLLLQPLDKSVRRTAKPAAASVQAMRLETLESASAATLQLIADARRQLTIYSRDLEYALYGHNEIVEALKQFALRNRGGGVRIIIQEPANLRGQTHPVLELAQRLTSHFQICAPVEAEDLQYLSAFLLNDSGGYLFRLLGNRYEGHWSPNLPAKNRRLQEEFERVWQRSRPCTEFRVLGL
ncbi:GNAT family N-acetyltransferase [Methylomonas rivi]|uniref:GNAT family N-acetyltransferase n=1 Tax=Methylomonas rivi TaxID=2952226 RepID=A0ABT1U3V1_9GAMM|nr:GNAT family N-acetyltransferase [Methylomonas sp. WSC-6]MCQ8128238.1 GNAT family N-acetyltransferase [Methylomonas sp. WSC-6]